MRPLCCALLLWLSFAPAQAHAYADIMIRNINAAGEGFNDPTPATPVGGNSGTTRGEQRLIAVQHAADLWGTLLDSEVPIVVEAEFAPLGCPDSGVATAGRAGPLSFELGVSGDGADPTLLYPQALANRLEGRDADPARADIQAQFNTQFDDPACSRTVGTTAWIGSQGTFPTWSMSRCMSWATGWG